ncbi:hypothetical protein HDV06_004531 [Boothiomyces sp. JEL0866]|nr:hypothetical protein HDV06_004531 [Boothiomyces sp. JEL0866]
MEGFYCPNTVANDSSTIPVYCPPSIECMIKRLFGAPCSDGRNGSQGIYEPVVCKMGNYCPTPQEMYQCPENYYCLTGTVNPTKCDYLAYCPNGSIYQRPYYGLLICAIVDLLLIAVNVWFKKGHHKVANYCKKTLDVRLEVQKAFERNYNGLNIKLDFRMENLGLQLQDGRTVLNDITGYIRAAKITAIMGPSETTFLSVLSGKVKRTAGKLFVSGKEMEMQKFKNFIGFVPQEDVMHRDMTVRENISYSAKIKLPSTWKSSEIDELSHVAHSIIGDETSRGISGGQRKRVNIGMELVSTPLCLFLDEPTSGLDATSALEVMEILSDLTKIGLTVVAFIRFDECLLIVPGGKTAYLGATANVKPYFLSLGFQFPLHINEADILMDILGNRGILEKSYNFDDLCTYWEEFTKKIGSAKEQSSIVQNETSKRNSLIQDEAHYSQFHSFVEKSSGNTLQLQQFFHCHLFALKKQLRNASSLFLEIFVSTACAAIIGAQGDTSYDKYIGLYKGNFINLPNPIILWGTPVVFQAVGMAAAIAASIPGIATFGYETTIATRYFESGHSIPQYFFGKMVASLYRIVISSFHFTSVLVFLSPTTPSFFGQWIIHLLLYFGVYGISHFCSAITSVEKANVLATCIALVSSMFCGYGPTLAQVKDAGVYFLWCLHFNMWGAEAQISQTYTQYDLIYDTETSAAQYGYVVNRVGFDYAMMFLLGIAWRMATYIGLHYVNWRKHN